MFNTVMGDNGLSSRDNLKNMLRILAKFKTGLKIVHINAQSLNNKLDEFRDTFINSYVDVVCVSESWFHPDINDGILTVTGFNIFRADRYSNGGGVAIYVKTGINCTIKCKSIEGCCIEYLFLELKTVDNNKMLLGCVYRPNNNTEYDFLISIIENISLNYNDVVIVGDFNSNILNENGLAGAFQTLGLLPTNTTVPTHFTTTSSSLLDVFFVSRKSKIQLYDQLSAPGFSKHDLIFLTYDLDVNQQSSNITYRDFKNINWNLLHQHVEEISWDTIYRLDSVDDQLEFFQNNITAIYNNCVPVKTKVIRNKQQPWYNLEIKSLIDVRNLAYKRWKRFKTPQLLEGFRSARIAVVKKINAAKSSYFQHKFQSAVDSKCRWKEIRSIGIGERKNSPLQSNLNVNELNERFVNVNVNSVAENTYANMCTVPIENCFSFRCVDDAEVLQSLLSIKSNAVGTDEINPIFLKILLPKLLPYITYLFNTVLTKSIFPHGWKLAKVIPILKQKN